VPLNGRVDGGIIRRGQNFSRGDGGGRLAKRVMVVSFHWMVELDRFMVIFVLPFWLSPGVEPSECLANV